MCSHIDTNRPHAVNNRCIHFFFCCFLIFCFAKWFRDARHKIAEKMHSKWNWIPCRGSDGSFVRARGWKWIRAHLPSDRLLTMAYRYFTVFIVSLSLVSLMLLLLFSISYRRTSRHFCVYYLLRKIRLPLPIICFCVCPTYSLFVPESWMHATAVSFIIIIIPGIPAIFMAEN